MFCDALFILKQGLNQIHFRKKILYAEIKNNKLIYQISFMTKSSIFSIYSLEHNFAKYV